MNDLQPRNSNRNLFIIIGLLIVILLCICACVGIAGGVMKAVKEQPEVESVIDAYMRAMTGHDARKAHSLLSTRAQRTVSLADIEILSEGNNYVLFENYQGVTITDFTFTITSDPDPDMPQGQVAEVQGVISYFDGFTGTFAASLEKEGQEWRLYSIDVIVSPDKFGP